MKSTCEDQERVYVAASTIVGAGGGLFARTSIRAGEVIANYRGSVVDTHTALGYDYDRTYLMWVGNRLVDGNDAEGRLILKNKRAIDVHGFTYDDWCRLKSPGVAWRGTSGLARFVNHAVRAKDRNATLSAKHGRMGFVARRDIAAGSEILSNYGSSYWKTKNANVCARCKKPGLLIECDGRHCHRSFHLGCVRPAIRSVPNGEWCCPICTHRKTSAEIV